MTPLQEVMADLRRTLARLERHVASGRPLDEQVLDALADADLSTTAVASLIRRRRGDVLRTVKLLEAAGRIRRTADGRRWTHVE